MLIKKIEHSYENFELNIFDIELCSRSINGLVGKNGAGKTTLMEILSGFRKSNKFFDVEGLNEKELLFIPSDLLVYDYLTVEEFLNFIIKYSETTASIQLLLYQLDLENKADTLIGELSQGMKKKLTLVPLFTKEYSAIILDEPFNSIDMEYIYTLKKYLIELRKNATIIISSHILDTLADICDTVVLIENGNVKKHIKDSISIKKLERELFE